MKTLFLLLNLFFLLHSNGKEIQLVYKSEIPEDRSGMIFLKKTSKDYLDRAELILKKAEKDIIKLAKEKDAHLVEIYVLEKANGEIPTESQIGRLGFVSLLVSLK
ncbi:hypothetical protein [Cecembia calidifontis]|uniref:Uncharacterized protein n=1 Tax=Cecembia calidifontis TaxID=1187080 RepID=A0A4V2F6R6_9BACT|nr:hypothetical protein [Cecembia calidifontis]RZS97249.1 hypothetical protein BC751_2852 [Cecembia calidifontis]